jgi:hypothetical protein
VENTAQRHKNTFQKENFWNDELINLENEMLFCALKTSS